MITFATTENSKRDIVFLVDGSDDSRGNFQEIKAFVQGIVVTLNLENNQDRVAVVQYSDKAETNFHLNTHSTKSEIITAITSLSHKGGYPHNLGAALQHVEHNIFTPGYGSRRTEGVSQIVIVLSGGRSGDDIRAPLKHLKETGVILIGVGTTGADTLELQTMSHKPNYALKINDYGKLSTIQRNVLSLVGEVSVKTEHIDPIKSFGKVVFFLLPPPKRYCVNP